MGFDDGHAALGRSHGDVVGNRCVVDSAAYDCFVVEAQSICANDKLEDDGDNGGDSEFAAAVERRCPR